jgi:hypothetical protein
MKRASTVLSASLLTVLLSGAAIAAPDFSGIDLSPVREAAAAAQQTPSGSEATHRLMNAEQAKQARLTAVQQCQAMEKRFDHATAPDSLKAATTPQGALRAEGGQLCHSQPHAATRYLRAAIATLNAQLQATEVKTHTT